LYFRFGHSNDLNLEGQGQDHKSRDQEQGQGHKIRPQGVPRPSHALEDYIAFTNKATDQNQYLDRRAK